MRTYERLIIVALTTIFAAIPALSQTPRSPSMSTDDLGGRRVAARAFKPGAVTRLHIMSETSPARDGKKEFTFTGDDCLFELPNETATFDANDDGQVDSLEIRVKCQDMRVELKISTARMGFNITPGTYEGAVTPSSEIREGRPGFYLGGWSWPYCDSSGNARFRIYEAEFDLSRRIPALVSFAASFEQSCPDYNRLRTVKGTFYYNAVPVNLEAPARPAERKGRPKAGSPG